MCLSDSFRLGNTRYFLYGDLGKKLAVVGTLGFWAWGWFRVVAAAKLGDLWVTYKLGINNDEAKILRAYDNSFDETAEQECTL